MLQKIRLVLIISTLHTMCNSQTSIDPELWKDIFTLENITVTPTTGPSIITDGDESCLCVPYYLCDPETNTTFTDGKIDGFGIIDIRFKPESCQESLDVCCKEPRDATNPLIPIDKPERLRGCGVRNERGVDFQINGSSGREAEFAEFPWTIALMYANNGSSFCGGSLIHPQVVLTGAHCIYKRKTGDMKIRAGEWDTQTIKERLPHQERFVRKIISHPQYNSLTLANDMALLILNEPLVLADNINTICIPDHNANFETAKGCYATGWGKDYFGKAGRYAVIMKKVELDTVDFNTCQRQLQKTRLSSRFKLHNSFLCAGGQKGKDTCEGDGGAPLVCPSYAAGRYYQAGIVAWGVGCGEVNVPAAYTYVSKFRTWIDGHMQSEGFDTSSYILVE